jgi:hypothetical protein
MVMSVVAVSPLPSVTVSVKASVPEPVAGVTTCSSAPARGLTMTDGPLVWLHENVSGAAPTR